MSAESSTADIKLLRKSHSLPDIKLRNDSGIGLSAGGVSCSILDQIATSVLINQHKKEKVPCNTRLVADFRQLLTLRQHYYPEGGWGWLLVIISVIVQSISHGLHMAIGILIIEMVNEYKQSSINAVWLSALSTTFGLILSPLTISLCKRKSTRLIAVIGGLVTALGCLFTSFAVQFHQLFFSFGIIVGIGVGITRDCSTLMVTQYFKKKREIVEIFIVAGSGSGIILMSILYKKCITLMGWRLGLQTITGVVFLTFVLGLFYRSVSLYHPQRRAILHLKNQRRKVKDKNKKQNRHPPLFDFKTLKSKTVRILLVSSAISAFGIFAPIFYLTQMIQLDSLETDILLLQTYLGLGWILGCIIFGFLLVRNTAECRISKQYLCQTSSMVCGLCIIAFTGVNRNLEGCMMFVWIYGIFCGGYNYSLKVYTYERVRARNFARVWSFVQCAQALPILFGMPIIGYINMNVSNRAGCIFAYICTLIGCLILFLVDVHKRNMSRHEHIRSNGTKQLCNSMDCPQNKRLSFSHEPDNEQAITLAGTNILLATDILNQQLNIDINDGNNKDNNNKPELTCISEEGIADMDLPDNLFNEFDYIGDCITSCNKVENYLMLSEFENNLNIELPVNCLEKDFYVAERTSTS